jgi:hypothetical protein
MLLRLRTRRHDHRPRRAPLAARHTRQRLPRAPHPPAPSLPSQRAAARAGDAAGCGARPRREHRAPMRARRTGIGSAPGGAQPRTEGQMTAAPATSARQQIPLDRIAIPGARTLADPARVSSCRSHFWGTRFAAGCHGARLAGGSSAFSPPSAMTKRSASGGRSAAGACTAGRM